jgi:hypothetical protein
MKDKAESILACGVVLLFFWMMFSLAKCTLDKHKAEPKWRWKEICKDNDKRAEFIVNCAKAANPMSDEEGEDLVLQCERTSRNLFCDSVKEYY